MQFDSSLRYLFYTLFYILVFNVHLILLQVGFVDPYKKILNKTQSRILHAMAYHANHKNINFSFLSSYLLNYNPLVSVTDLPIIFTLLYNIISAVLFINQPTWKISRTFDSYVSFLFIYFFIYCCC